MSTAASWVIAIALILIAFALFAIGDKLGKIAEALHRQDRQSNEDRK